MNCLFKRIFDITFSLFSIVLLSPFILLISLLIWLQDFNNPIYTSTRASINGEIFNIFKFRTMIINAESYGIDSTSSDDFRITPLGKYLRAFKIDEIPQLLNVLLGQMSIVGPRPQILSNVETYTKNELNILQVRPGITDLSSIFFSNEGEILKGSDDPDLEYNLLIRPWKSRLALLYVNNSDIFLDLAIIALTILAIANRNYALRYLCLILEHIGTDKETLDIVSQRRPLYITPLP